MFSLTKNSFLKDGTCKYTDEYGNSVFVKRDGQKFVARLRFGDKSVVAEPLYYDPFSAGKDDGAFINIKYPSGTPHDREDLAAAVQGLIMIVQRWIGLLTAIDSLQTNNHIIGQGCGMSDEEVARKKLRLIFQYEELSELARIF